LGDKVFVDQETGEPIPHQGHPYNVKRENTISFDGYRTGFITNNNGKVVYGNGDNVLQNMKPKTTNVNDMENYWVEIPAGGYGMSFKTQYNNASITGKFCEMDIDLTIQYFDPYFTSVDGTNGSDPDLGKNLWQ
jgi:hypothetical protein